MLPRESVGHGQRVDGPNATKPRRRPEISNRERRAAGSLRPRIGFGFWLDWLDGTLHENTHSPPPP